MDAWTFACLFFFPITAWLATGIRRRGWSLHITFVRRGIEAASLPTFFILLLGLIRPDLLHLINELTLYTSLAGFTGLIHTLLSIYDG